MTNQKISRVGVVGAGQMGAGIAEVCARAHADVLVYEHSRELVVAGRAPEIAENDVGDRSDVQRLGVDFGGTFLLGTILPLIGWGFWASFVFSVLVEARAALNNVTAPQLAGLRPQQALAGALVAAVLAIGAGTPATAMTAQPSTNGSSISTQLEDTPTQPTDQADARQYTIQTGDTLWGVAEQKLGDGSRWSELAEGLKNRPQADGTTMSDPNLIYVGWTVELPGDQTASSGQRTAPTDQATDQPDVASEAPASESAPATEQAPASEQAPATPPASVPGEVVPQSEREQSPAPDQEASPVPGAAFAVAPDQPASDRAEAETAQPEQVEWSTLGGIGAFAAAGLLGVLGARRAMQRRRRRPGQQVPMPEAEHAQIEAQLKVVAEAEQADELDVVQRWLARWAQQSGTTLPELFLVRVSAQEIALYLMGPAQLPAPFVAAAEDGTVWTLQSGAIELDADLPSAPWPGLVTVGQDDTDAQVLLDLERLEDNLFRGVSPPVSLPRVFGGQVAGQHGVHFLPQFGVGGAACVAPHGP